MDHPNICKLYQTFDSGKYLLIVLEVCRGDLFDVINKHGQLKEHLARQIFGQLASAVNYMHSKGWVHRDLKPVCQFLWVILGVMSIFVFFTGKCVV